MDSYYGNTRYLFYSGIPKLTNSQDIMTFVFIKYYR